MADCMTTGENNLDKVQNGIEEGQGNAQVNGIDGSGDGPVLQNHVQQEGEKLNSESKHHSSSKHKSSHSDKHRDGENKSGSDKHKHSSSSDKHKHSSSSDKHRHSSSDKHKHSSSSDKHKHSSSSDKHKHSSSSSDKHKSSSSSGDKHKHSSSSDKHKSSGDSKHKSSSHSSSSSKDKDKHRSSSSSSKHHSSSKDKSHSSSSHRSSSSGEKHSSSSDKHRSDKEKHRSDKEKHREQKENLSGEKKVEVKKEVMPIKSEPLSPVKVEKPIRMDESDDDVPLSARKEVRTIKKEGEKRPAHSDAEDEEPLSERVKKIKTEDEFNDQKIKKRKSNEDEDYTPSAKKKKKDEKKKKVKQEPITSPSKVKTETGSPTKKAGRVKKEETGQPEKWKWWEEQEEKEEGVKWTFLEHKGVVFAPDYEPLPKDVRFYYEGKQIQLSEEAEEVAGFYAKMLDHDYTTREVFNRNFFKDFRKVMNDSEKRIITDLSKCNFKEMYTYFKQKSEERKAMSKEEKKKIKEQNEELVKEYGFCKIDGHKEKVGNFRIEPPGLFRGRGEHPKQGVLKRRVIAEDIIINCSKDSKIPQPPPGHRWKEVRHDNKVTWLASWTENVQNQTKYVMLAATSKLKGEKDMMKYETARKLHQRVDKIRANYREDFKNKEMRIRQRSVALYFIDKLALRAGNEKDEETADTVGCCSLRWEHIKLHPEKDGKENVVEFDFLGKDSIRYHNEVSVEKRVFKNLQLFMENKSKGDDLFDRLNTTIMNKHLNTLMEGLTAKVFRTYNASRTLQEQLELLTNPEDPVAAKILAYNRANRAVAVLCNHQRAVSKNFGKQMENLQAKIDAKKEVVHNAKKDVKAAKSDYKALKTEAKRKVVERKKKILQRLEEQLEKLEISLTDKDENKEIALGTSKLNYLDPRISVAWCKKWEVPIEKVYNKTQRDKFAWAIEMADEDYKFTDFDEN